MSLQFSVGAGSLGEENLILLSDLKEALKPKHEKILGTLKGKNKDT